ncbi:hypothetical protein [Jejuia pallidilutea]|uniref:Redox-active disulfide protein 2 n=2 Tax=Jejuia pallidilutea TaxID=504487 RepID=A0A098LRQ3_9FLAO|nr:hypothetical protein [Jejuia pallidilutea]PQV49573.1 hypothetical protein CLV33_103209 [Jejuia pallidilutea]GAL89033.1 hypothetical protein JCM19538_2022 [Jejuia pallidilutea]
MKRDDLKAVSTLDLQKKFKTFKMAFYVLAGIVGVMFVISYFNWKESGINATVLLPLFFIPMVLVNFFNLRKIKQELASRKDI